MMVVVVQALFFFIPILVAGVVAVDEIKVIVEESRLHGDQTNYQKIYEREASGTLKPPKRHVDSSGPIARPQWNLAATIGATLGDTRRRWARAFASPSCGSLVSRIAGWWS